MQRPEEELKESVANHPGDTEQSSGNQREESPEEKLKRMYQDASQKVGQKVSWFAQKAKPALAAWIVKTIEWSMSLGKKVNNLFKDRPNKWKYIASGLAASVLLFFYATPYWSVYRLYSALDAGDSKTVNSYIDYKKFRESLKAKLNSEIMKNSGSPEEAMMGGAFVSALFGPLIDSVMTPEGMAALLREGTIDKRGKSAKHKKKDNEDVEMSMGYSGLNSFSVTLRPKDTPDEPVKLIFKRAGIVAWKLAGLE